MGKYYRNSRGIFFSKAGKPWSYPGIVLWMAFLFLLVAVFTGVAQQKGTIRGVVKDARTGEALPGVNIQVKGTLLGTSTDTDGAYFLELAPGDYTLVFSFIGYKTVEKGVSVAAGQTVTVNLEMEEDVLHLSEIVVVGTHRTDRTVVESPTPIDVLTVRELRQTGLAETNQILEMLLPSFNFPRPTITDGTDHVRPATLRGLSPDQTLVLVNGKRRHPSALVNVNGSIGRGSQAVDLNSIPSNAIERIEVLRDGASAQYGSDAIAGVINVILKSNAEKRLYASFGQTKAGDGQVVQIDGDYGVTFGTGGFVHVSGEFRRREPTNRAGLDPRRQYFYVKEDTLPDGSIIHEYDPRELSFNRKNHRYGDSKAIDYILFLNAGYPLSNTMSFYAFGGYNFRHGEAGGFYRRALDNRTVRAIYPDGFLPLIAPDITDISGTVGLKGNWGKWAWDFSNAFGRDAYRFNVIHSVNVSLGTASPTDFYAGTLLSQQNTTTLDVVRGLDMGFATPVTLALGAEFRWENYQMQAGEEASWKDGGVPVLDGPNAGARTAVGSQVFPGFRPSDEKNESRTNVAAYASLEGNPVQPLMLSLAGRFENYSDFGTTINGKLATRLALTKSLALRASVSNGFRAPSLGQSFYSSTATVFIDNIPYEIRTFPVNDPVARALGAKDLKPEKSLNYSAGLTLNPTSNFSLSVDAYYITIKDRIVLSENFIGSSIRDFLEQMGFPGVTGGRFFTNAVDTKTQGAELVARYALPRSRWGRLIFTFSGYLNKTKVTRVTETPPQLAGFKNVLLGRSEKGRIEEGQPRDKFNLMVQYEWGNLSIMARAVRFGKFTFRHRSDPKRDQTFSPKVLTDLDISYQIANRFQLAVGGNNIFDVYPDKAIPANSFHGIFPYTLLSPYGFNGAYYYTRFSLNL